MHAMILALVLQANAGAPAAGSLGIGIDVLPEAFAFAATRADYAPQLRLAGCDARACRWHLGGGVDMTASLTPAQLDVSRVEAELSRPASATDLAAYRKACLAIVALFDPAASDTRRRSIADAIAAPPDAVPQVALRASDVETSFYGAPARCGAVASFADVDAPP